jgi:hypothetical protein
MRHPVFSNAGRGHLEIRRLWTSLFHAQSSRGIDLALRPCLCFEMLPGIPLFPIWERLTRDALDLGLGPGRGPGTTRVAEGRIAVRRLSAAGLQTRSLGSLGPANEQCVGVGSF